MPQSPFTGCEAASLPFALFECQVHRLPILLGAGPLAARHPRLLRRIPMQTPDSPRTQLPPSQGLAEHILNPVQSAAPELQLAARARPGSAHLRPVTQGRSVREWVEVGGTDPGRAGNRRREARSRSSWSRDWLWPVAIPPRASASPGLLLAPLRIRCAPFRGATAGNPPGLERGAGSASE